MPWVFLSFFEDEDVKLIGVEAGGEGVSTVNIQPLLALGAPEFCTVIVLTHARRSWANQRYSLSFSGTRLSWSRTRTFLA